MTTVNGKVGFWSLALLYGAFSVANLFSAIVVFFLGERLSLMGGAALYTLFIGANIYVIDWVLLPISFLMGIGAAVLWTAQGVRALALFALLFSRARVRALTQSRTNARSSQCSPSARPRRRWDSTRESCVSLLSLSLTAHTTHTLSDSRGISMQFWAMFQFNGVLGNIFAASLLSAGLDTGILFGSLFVVAAIASVSFIVLRFVAGTRALLASAVCAERDDASRPAPKPAAVDGVASSDDDAKDKKLNPLATLQLFRDERMMFMALIMIYSGLTYVSSIGLLRQSLTRTASPTHSQSFFTGAFPPVFGKDIIGWVLAVFSFFDTVGTYAPQRMPCVTWTDARSKTQHRSWQDASATRSDAEPCSSSQASRTLSACCSSVSLSATVPITAYVVARHISSTQQLME